MANLIEIIKNLFESDKAITNEDGQKVVTFDAILPEVEGLKLFEDVTSDEGGQQTNEFTQIDLANYVTADQLSELIDRLIKLESLVLAVDDLTDKPVSEVEVW